MGGNYVSDFTVLNPAQVCERIKQTADIGPDALLIVDKELRIILSNRQAELTFGFSCEEMKEQFLGMLLPERFRSTHLDHVSQFLLNPVKRPMGTGISVYCVHKDGREFPVDISLNPLQTADGLLIACYVRDISLQKQVNLALRESHQTYQALFEYANDAIFLISLDGVHVQVNQKAADLLGYSREELVGMEITKVVAPGEYPDAQNKLKELMQGISLPLYERLFRKKDGTIIPVEINIALVRDLDGNPKYIQSIVRDITEHKAAKANLKRMADQRQQLLDLSMEMLLTNLVNQAFHIVTSALSHILDLDFGFVAQVDEIANLLQPRYLLGADHVVRFIENQTFPLEKGGLMNLVYQSGVPLLQNNAQDDPRVVRPGGRKGAQEHVIIVPIQISGKRYGVLTIGRTHARPFQQDEFELAQVCVALTGTILQKARLFHEIEEKVEQIQVQQQGLRALSSRLEQVREEERRQLAVELHDRVGQMLTAIKLNLQVINHQVPQAADPPVFQRIKDTMQLLDETTTIVRNVMADLRPPMLDDYGLLSTLKWYGQNFSKQTGIKTQVIGVEAKPRLSGQYEITLFRIAQEALNNTAKYAQASQVEIHLESSPQAVRLNIFDNGKGFDMQEVFAQENRPHWGLMGMRERAASIGSELVIASRPGDGTWITVEIDREGSDQ